MATIFRIGLLHTGSNAKFGGLATSMLNAAKKVIQKRGNVGDDIEIFSGGHYANDDLEKLEEHALLLAKNPQVNVIVAAGGPQSAIAAMDATAEVKPVLSERRPVIFTTVADPVGLGLVDSLTLPGRNLTGMAGQTTENDAIRLELLHAFTQRPGPNIGVLINPSREGNRKAQKPLKKVAKKLGLTLVAKRAGRNKDIEDAFQEFRTLPNFVGVVVAADSFFNNRRDKVIAAALAPNPSVPAIYQWRQFVEDGGLISYGPNIEEAYQVAGRYAARCCLGGDTPGEMPCAAPTKFELVVNTATAAALGITVPTKLEHDDLGDINVIPFP